MHIAQLWLNKRQEMLSTLKLLRVTLFCTLVTQEDPLASQDFSTWLC